MKIVFFFMCLICTSTFGAIDNVDDLAPIKKEEKDAERAMVEICTGVNEVMISLIAYCNTETNKAKWVRKVIAITVDSSEKEIGDTDPELDIKSCEQAIQQLLIRIEVFKEMKAAKIKKQIEKPTPEVKEKKNDKAVIKYVNPNMFPPPGKIYENSDNRIMLS